MKILDSEFTFTYARSSGAGGQNVNKVNTKVTLTWDIEKSSSINSFVKDRFITKYTRYITGEGLVKIVSQKYRTQQRNISDTINKLHELLESVAKPPKKRIDTKPTRSSKQKRITSKKNKGQIKKNRKKVDY